MTALVIRYRAVGKLTGMGKALGARSVLTGLTDEDEANRLGVANLAAGLWSEFYVKRVTALHPSEQRATMEPATGEPAGSDSPRPAGSTLPLGPNDERLRRATRPVL